MARTTVVKKARKDQGACMSPNCRHESRAIRRGDSYKWFAIRAYRGGRGQRKQYHVDCPVPRSHMTTSAQLGAIYDAQESAEEAMSGAESADDLRSIAEECAQGIREAGEMYGEGADNIESGFGHETYISQELREKADGCESWADEIEQVDFDDFEEEDVRLEVEEEVAAAMGATFENHAAILSALHDIDADVEEFERRVNDEIESRRESLLDDMRQRLQDAIDNQPF